MLDKGFSVLCILYLEKGTMEETQILGRYKEQSFKIKSHLYKGPIKEKGFISAELLRHRMELHRT